ncbi:Arabinanase/levansucrase/invertase [Amylocarpus encephaloides]|uniref:Arabinanase/levansucrase/invertase n=1 Tax=Amylocarpus encephaloides TaxID=45428 RepID=A0A9P7YQL7_9HELO|nr:Arabinanase/levansucrase/invertase [Amylocarpus encephaloides]
MFLQPTLLFAALVASIEAASWIVPGAVWNDVNGKKIDAHGGNIVQRGDTFYWVGQAASQDVIPVMYSSTDLLNWTPLGTQNSLKWLWRPKIAKPNGKFWIYGQLDRSIQSLVSDQMVGGYRLNGAAVRIPPNSYSYSDTGMFLDSDSTWYILTSADHNIVQINKLNSDGSVGARASQLADGALEAPGMLKVGGTYYLIVSGKTGWRSNPNKVYTSSSINGPWTGGADIAPPAEKTYNSQNTFELTIKGSQKTTYIYMGDSWDSKGGPSSNHVWLPIKVDEARKSLVLEYHAMWKVDTRTGVVSWPAAGKRYQARHAESTGSTEIVRRESAVGKHAVRGISESGQAIFRNVTGGGRKQWVSFHYTVNDQEAGEAHVTVNSDALPTNISSLNCRAGFHKTVPIELHLEKGDENVIRFGATGSKDFEATIDGIEVFDDEEEL